MSLHPHPPRVAAIIATVVRESAEGRRQVSGIGSGYLIRGGAHPLVITAEHNVAGTHSARVRLFGADEPVAARVLWRDPAIDVAVLELVDDEGRPRALGSIKVKVGVKTSTTAELDDWGPDPHWAACRGARLRCGAVGYPDYQRRAATQVGAGGTGKKAETGEFVGWLRPDSGLHRGQLDVIHDGPARPDWRDWQGMSGAALFADGLLVGVIAISDVDSLRAWPLAPLLERQDFLDAVGPSLAAQLVPHALWPEADRPARACLEDWSLFKPEPEPESGLPQVEQPSKLLLARHERVPFNHDLRAQELAALEAFLSAPGSGVAIVRGPGGVGKTRLAWQWCRELRDRGWLAGFANPTVHDLAPAARGLSPRLLVLDYAETQLPRVATLLGALPPPHVQPQTKVLLLARDAHEGWVRALANQAPAIEAHLEHAPRIAIAALDAVQAQAAYDDAYRAFSPHAALSPQPPSHPAEHAPPDRQRMLLAHMRALLAALGEQDIPERIDAVLARVLQHETKIWRQRTHARLGLSPTAGVPPRLLEHARCLGAVLVLTDGLPLAQLAPFIQQIIPALAQHSDHLDALHECFAGLYAHGHRLLPLEPDLLGEQLVYEFLCSEQDRCRPVQPWLELGLQPDLDLELQPALTRTLTVLTRLAAPDERDLQPAQTWLAQLLHKRGRDWAEALTQGHRPIPGDRLAAALTATRDHELAQLLAPVIPERTVELRELGVAVSQLLVDHQRTQTQDESGRSRLAAALNNLGLRLSDLGQREPAFDAIQEAVGIRRPLAQTRPDAFLPDLARSLNNLGKMLSELGQPQAALDAAQEAIDIHRPLAQTRPEDFRPDLARSLNNLGVGLSQLGQPEPALDAIHEAIHIYRTLAQARPDAFLPHLAGSLINLSISLNKMGQGEAALDSTHEAIDTYRTLAQARPDAFLPHLASSLSNLGIWLNEMGQPEPALDAIREAIYIHRRLAQAHPDAFLPDLSSSLHNLGAILGELDQPGPALDATREAIDTYRTLAQARPDAFLSDLARTLWTHGDMLNALGRPERAAEAFAEGIRATLPLLDSQPHAVAGLLQVLLQRYAETCEAADLEPAEDLALLLEALAQAQTPDDSEP